MPKRNFGIPKPDPVEIVAVTVPVLCEAIAVVFFIGVAVLLAGIWSGSI